MNRSAIMSNKRLEEIANDLKELDYYLNSVQPLNRKDKEAYIGNKFLKLEQALFKLGLLDASVEEEDPYNVA